MRIDIKTKNLNDKSKVTRFIENKIHSALDRIEARIDKVTVRLEDETKDSNRFDGVCRIEVDVHPRGYIHVSSSGESFHDCILQATRKMEYAVKHEIDRSRKSAKIRHQQTKRDVRELLATEHTSGVQ